MKKLNAIFIVVLIFGAFTTNAQSTVTDYDGNVYNTVIIGTQTWLKENIKSMHYSDGNLIPNAAAYNNDEGLAAIYGRLYTWNATVRDSITANVQGICPCGWHVANDAEWTELETNLGGAAVAGGKMKDITPGYWNAPNTGATNSSGFTALPGGEFDAYYTPNVFQYLHESAVFWTSTQYNTTKAKERYIMYNDQSCLPYNWYKVMKYSVRCIKNSNSSVSPSYDKSNLKIINPTGDKLQIIYESPVDLKSVEIFNIQGQLIKREEFINSPSTISIQSLKIGIYIARFYLGTGIFVKKINKIE